MTYQPDPARGRRLLEYALEVVDEKGTITRIMRGPTDDVDGTTRISCAIKGSDAVLAYRGDLDEAVRLAEACFVALMTLADDGVEPMISPEAGKKFT